MVQAEETVEGTSTIDSSDTTVIPEQTGAPPADGEAATEEAPDYKVLYEQEQERFTKADNDLKSVRGQRAKQANIETSLQGLTNEMAGLREVNSILARSVAGDGSVDVKAEVGRVQQNQQFAQASSRAQAGVNLLFESFQRAITGEDGTNLAEGEYADVFSGSFAAWDTARNDQTSPMDERMVAFSLASAAATEARGEVNAMRAKKETSVADRAAAGADLDMDSGGTSVGGQLSDEEFNRRYASGSIPANSKNNERMVKIKRAQGLT